MSYLILFQLKAKKEQEKHKEKKKNLEAINQWKDEIRNKGDKAKDLKEFMKPKNDERYENTGKQFGGKARNDRSGKMASFSKKVSKNTGHQRASKRKMPKQKRPGKVTRMMMKNKKFSGKSKR